MFKSVGIVGYGAFGKLLANKLSQIDGISVCIFSSHTQTSLLDGVEQLTLEQLASQSDLIILAIPFGSYQELLAQLKPSLRPETVIMDVCSVKMRPLKLLKEQISNPILLTHPLLGPESDDSARQVVLCNESSESCLDDFKELVQKLDWEIIRMSAEEHDRQMAVVHGLTFFVAESLIRMDYQAPSIPTGFYRNLQKLMDIQRKHSSELTETIEKYNPYAAEVRTKFIEVAKTTDQDFRA